MRSWAEIRIFIALKWAALLEKLGIWGRIDYVGGAEALPPPLTQEEEVLLLSRLKEGDKDVRTTLIERNLRLVVYIAKKFESTGIPIDDLVSVGSIGLIKAVSTFDTGKNIKLATYASKCIENEILMYLRRTMKSKSEVSFDEPLNIDAEGNELCLSDVKGTPEDTIYSDLEKEDDKEVLRLVLSRLPWRERTIVDLRFGLKDGVERTQKQVADMLGISQSYISRLEKKIMQKLHKDIVNFQ
ncbi:MAG: RNA polymerase sporulation sigma factor SigE [Candidatus Fermentithermobacillus carboniphilus]|uniref:RNA polymerase sigma factor n=1 Tax=Candidatus Fermentithermobacillus carboniphilus TaxID=3085328 RepID=A0AAT9LBQ6_9FIRM|nr:MAG: RNA polymerase sporulation sigma factor SigE [Candidatus Fermentithermobacillus carboniphilus]